MTAHQDLSEVHSCLETKRVFLLTRALLLRIHGQHKPYTRVVRNSDPEEPTHLDCSRRARSRFIRPLFASRSIAYRTAFRLASPDEPTQFCPECDTRATPSTRASLTPNLGCLGYVKLCNIYTSRKG
jgi:hypothetical protein